MALWSGRFERDVDEFTQRFGASLPIDRRMYRQDIAASIAHARMLGRQGIVSQEDAQDMVEGLSAIRESMDQGGFVWDVGDEDIHMAVERALTERIGAAGARLHTGRSRNDQVATDIRLFAKQAAGRLMEENCRTFLAPPACVLLDVYP